MLAWILPIHDLYRQDPCPCLLCGVYLVDPPLLLFDIQLELVPVDPLLFRQILVFRQQLPNLGLELAQLQGHLVDLTLVLLAFLGPEKLKQELQPQTGNFDMGLELG